MFITFEGGDGSGKTTQIQLLAQYLTEQGFVVVTTREPGGTELGKEIRRLLLHSGEVCPKAEALLYAADRAHNIATKVRPALKAGHIILADRYLDSSVAYQGAARSLGKDEVRDLSLWATDGLLPDLTILLDVPTGIGRSRVGKEQDRIEAAGESFHDAVRSEYLELAQREPERWRVIDARRAIDDIALEIRGIVAQALDVASLAVKSTDNPGSSTHEAA